MRTILIILVSLLTALLFIGLINAMQIAIEEKHSAECLAMGGTYQEGACHLNGGNLTIKSVQIILE